MSGIVVKEYQYSSPARRKLLKNKLQLISISEIKKLSSLVEEIKDKDANEIQQEKTQILDAYKSKYLYKQEMLELLKPDLDKAFASFHEYRDFVSQISQNINVILETRYKDQKNLEDKLGKALHAEKSIYWLAKLMEQNLNITRFSKNLWRINDSSEKSVFSLYGLFLKHLRIYQMAFDEANIEAKVFGKSEGRISADSGMVGIIIHTLIDNAFKYSPKIKNNSKTSLKQDKIKVTISFEESSENINLSVSSYGPRISEEEKNKIFEPFTRGEEAKKIKEEGTGFGLYISRVIAQNMGTDILVEQEKQPSKFGAYWTTFLILFKREV